MAMSAVYTTIDGELFSESRGGVSTLYVPDTLGSLAEARDASGAKVYEAQYWGYGEALAETGVNPSPWGFVGLLGYLRDFAGLLYVRARHYRPGLARWQTVDPLWPMEPAFEYGRLSPVRYIDPSGLLIPIACGVAAACAGIAVIASLIACAGDPRGYVACVSCWLAANPAVATAIAVGCGTALAICIGPWIANLLRPIISGGGVMAPAGAFAAGSGGGDDCAPFDKPQWPPVPWTNPNPIPPCGRAGCMAACVPIMVFSTCGVPPPPLCQILAWERCNRFCGGGGGGGGITPGPGTPMPIAA